VRFLVRGQVKVRGKWMLVATAHDICRLCAARPRVEAVLHPLDRVRTREDRAPETVKCSSLWTRASYQPPVTLDYDSHRCHERYYPGRAPRREG
jgi:hypothetical protein